jgi:hypothetical protein
VDGVLNSNILQAKNGARYMIILNLNNCTYKIRNLGNRTIVKSTEKTEKGPLNSVQWLKRVVRKRIAELGVEFDLDLRRHSEKV